MVRREAVAAGVSADVVDADGLRIAGDDAEQAVAVRRRSDPLALRPVDAAGDEALDPEVLVDDAERRVLGVGKLADAVRDQLKDAVQIQDAGDAARRRVERGKFVGRLSGPCPRPR